MMDDFGNTIQATNSEHDRDQIWKMIYFFYGATRAWADAHIIAADNPY